jgi:RES domain-containing protein
LTTVWRITTARYAHEAFDGRGAALAGGRWNQVGTLAVYCSATLSLAALEFFVHVYARELPSLRAFPIEIPEELEIVHLMEAQLPADWNTTEPAESTQRLGSAWAQKGNSAVLSVPSVLIPSERNYVLNPVHRDFPKIRVGKPIPFGFDPRMWKKAPTQPERQK